MLVRCAARLPQRALRRAEALARPALRQLAQPAPTSARTLSSSTLLASSSSRPQHARIQPVPTPETDTSEQLPPQPFLLRPRSRKYQLESVSTTPHSPSASTTLHFVSPAHPDQPRTLTLPNLWLRDASIHPDHVHPASQQRLFRTTDIPLGGKLIGYGVHELPGKGDCLVTEWSTALGSNVPILTAKLSVVPVDLLLGLLEGDSLLAEQQGRLPAPTPWDRQQLERTLHRVPYEAFRSDDVVLERTLERLIQDGICIVTGVPTTEREGQDKPELRKLVERIGSLRRTWYGDLWDVRAEDGSLNIAYTNLDLGLHMDLTHFDNPPRYQFLHSLQNTHVVGGLSYFVDTFALAQHLAIHNPAAFDTLAREHVQFEYRNGPHHTRFARPTLELKPGATTRDRIHAVNYSPPFQGVLPLERITRSPAPAAAAAAAGPSAASHATRTTTSDDAARLEELHDALKQFADLCDDPHRQWRFEHQLEPGECVIFDNRRVLHARTAFEFVRPSQGATVMTTEEEPGRWLKGAYMDGDELWSRWRVLKAKAKAKADQGGTKGRTLFV